MGGLLKFLSVLTGSSEETLLNTRAQISNRYGNSKMSNETERNYIISKITSDISKLFKPSQAKEMATIDIVGAVITYYCESGKTELVQTLNRVLVYYYNYELGNEKTLIPSLRSLAMDLERYIK